MKIAQALIKLKVHGNVGTISSKNAVMYEQDKDSLLFWLLSDPHSSTGDKHQELDRILSVSDWKVDRVKKTNL